MKEPIRINSRDNQHLKFARRVRERKERDHILIEGKRLCREAVSSAISIEQVFMTDAFDDVVFRSVVARDAAQQFILEDRLLNSIADTESPQGIVMIAHRPATRSVEELFQIREALPLWICLEKPNNPANLGAVLRTAEAAGVRGVFLTSNSADPFASKALRASMGSAFRIPIASVEELSDLFEKARSSGITIAAMAAGGKRDYLEMDWTKPTLLVVGSEADGLSKEITDTADQLIRIEMKKPVESLNLAVSAGVVMFEAQRQNRLANR
jgi:TrmH family RNA methyltransferase